MKLRLVLFVAALCVAPLAHTYAAQPMYLPAATDSMLVVIDIRDLPAIEHDLEEASARRAAAEVSESRARMLQARSVTSIKIAESEITSLKAEIDNAKMRKDEVQKKDLEGQKKFAELQKNLLQRRDDLRKQEIELAKAEIQFHEAEMKGFQTELELAHLRSQRAGLDGAVASKDVYNEAHKLAKEMRNTEGKALKAKIEAAEKGKTLADKSVQIMKARQKVFEARVKVLENMEGK